MSMNWLCAAALLACACGDTISISIELTYDQTHCNDVPARDKFMEAAGVATAHVIDIAMDTSQILDEACFGFPSSPFRTIEALPALLSENVAFDDLPLGRTIDVQIAVYEGEYRACEPFDPVDPIKVPAIAGRSGMVELDANTTVVTVELICPSASDTTTRL